MYFLYRYNKTIRIILTFIIIFVFPVVVGAQTAFDPGETFEMTNVLEEETGLGADDPITVASRIINIALTILGFFVLALFLYGGYIWMIARGNEEEVKKAKKILEGAIIGLVIVLASYGITQYIFFNIYRTTDPNALNE